MEIKKQYVLLLAIDEMLALMQCAVDSKKKSSEFECVKESALLKIGDALRLHSISSLWDCDPRT